MEFALENWWERRNASNVIKIPSRWFRLLVIVRFVWKLVACKPTDRVSEDCLTSVTHAHPLCYHEWQCSQPWIPSLNQNKAKPSLKNCITKVKCSASWQINPSHHSTSGKAKDFPRGVFVYLWWGLKPIVSSSNDKAFVLAVSHYCYLILLFTPCIF